MEGGDISPPRAICVREKCLLARLHCLYQRTVQRQIRTSSRTAVREDVIASGTVQPSSSCITSATERRGSHQCCASETLEQRINAAIQLQVSRHGVKKAVWLPALITSRGSAGLRCRMLLRNVTTNEAL